MLHPYHQEFMTRAFEYDVIENDAHQAHLTERLLLPKTGQIINGVRNIRDMFDRKFFSDAKSRTAHATSSPFGKLCHQKYPVGFCGVIRDALFDILRKSPLVSGLEKQGVLFKKIYIILDDKFFQNAIQFGDLYLDVANDTVDINKEKVVCTHFKEIRYRCFDDYDYCFDIAEKYLNIRLYPNLIFPMITPIFPVFAISENGEINLFNVHMVIAFKSIVKHYQPIREFLLNSRYVKKTLPSEYVRLISDRYKRNKTGFLFAEFDETATADKVISFIENKLQNPVPDKSQSDNTFFSIAMQAYQEFNQMALRPGDHVLEALREEGVIPEIRQDT